MSHGHGPQLGFWVVAPCFIAVGYVVVTDQEC